MNTVAIRTMTVNEAIGAALRGLSAKFVAKRIKTSTRTVEGWREGRTGPQAKHFVAMLQDDELCALLLEGVGLESLAQQQKILAAKKRLQELESE